METAQMEKFGRDAQEDQVHLQQLLVGPLRHTQKSH
jgi:hypothetical protein